MILSIVIPVYNIENYVARCLDSCLNQDLPATDYEVIAVDDGSPDRSADVIRPYLAKYPNLKYIHQANQGLSGARNTGFEHASGDYIWFVDGDDSIRENCLKDLTERVTAANCDMFVFDHKCICDEGETFYGPNVQANVKMSGQEFMIYFRAWTSGCQQCYKRQFLLANDLRFTLKLLAEDVDFYVRSYLRAKSVIYHHDYYYIYDRRRSDSITHSNYDRLLDSLFKMPRLLAPHLQDPSFSKELLQAINQALFKACIYTGMRILAHPGVPTDSFCANYPSLRQTVRGLAGCRKWKLIFLLPAPLLAGGLKAAFRLRSWRKR